MQAIEVALDQSLRDLSFNTFLKLEVKDTLDGIICVIEKHADLVEKARLEKTIATLTQTLAHTRTHHAEESAAFLQMQKNDAQLRVQGKALATSFRIQLNTLLNEISMKREYDRSTVYTMLCVIY